MGTEILPLFSTFGGAISMAMCKHVDCSNKFYCSLQQMDTTQLFQLKNILRHVDN